MPVRSFEFNAVFGNPRAALGCNCAAQLPPRLVHFPLLFQRGSCASTQIQPWSVEWRREQWGLDIQRCETSPCLEKPNPARKLHHSLCPKPRDNSSLWTQPPAAMAGKTEYLRVFSDFFRCISCVFVFSQLSSAPDRSGREAWFLCAQRRTAERAQSLLSYLPLNWQIPFLLQ